MRAIIGVIAVGILLVVGWAVLNHPHRAGPAPPEAVAPFRLGKRAQVRWLPTPRMPASAAPVQAQPTDSPPANLLADLLKEGQELLFPSRLNLISPSAFHWL
jgi:hypothetical protein